jgi:phosphoadenosine phosphosulfate reductase
MNTFNLDDKIKKAQEVIKKAAKLYPAGKITVGFTGGKDSTVLLHLIMSVYDGKIPFRVMFNDSTDEFPEIYKFVKKIKKLWNLKLRTIKHNKKSLEKFNKTKDLGEKQKMSWLMKIESINNYIKKYHPKIIMSGIRLDEHEARSKEKFFSKRDTHLKVHPLLLFTERDIWDYIHRFNVPYVALYDKGYRSLGEKNFTKKAIAGLGERSGRENSKEQTMEKLRNMGYW